MMIAGIVIAALMVIPGFPKLILLGVGAALFIFGWRLSKSKAKKEAALAAQAERAGASDYKITQAYTGNRVHMTAELLK